MRNDALLYSGSSSNSERRAEERRKRLENKQETRVKLAPAADVILAEIAKDKAATGELLLEIVSPDTPDDKVLQKLEAVRLHREWLISLESRIKKALRVSPSEIKAQKQEKWDE